MLADFTPPFDATVVSLLREAGARVVGKANCDEFGMGSLNVHSSHGPVVNPFRPSSGSTSPPRSAGGSSGGSAAAVAAGLCDVALGTDTGGSVRLPASYCGVVGFKPSYGLLSRWGVVSFADSLDCVGVLGRSTEGVIGAFDVLNQFDLRDPTAASQELRTQASDLSQSSWDGDIKHLRIGVPQEYFPTELSHSITAPLRKVLTALKKKGATIVPVSLPRTSYALSAYYVISSAEAGSNMVRYDGVQYGHRVPPPPGSDWTKTARVFAHTRTEGFGREVKKRVLLGTYALTADAFDNYFLQAQRIRELIKADFDEVFTAPNVLRPSSSSPSQPTLTNDGQGVHVLLHPSAIRTAPLLPSASSTTSAEGEEEDLSSYVQDVLTVPASLGGLPALSVPAGVAQSGSSGQEGTGDEEDGDGWPVGVSVVGQWGCDRMVLDVGRAVEEVVREL